MQIRNFSKGEILAENAKEMKGIIERSIGLRFARKPRALIFPFNLDIKPVIDMFFVKFPIDLVCLNKEKKVVELKESLMPFKTFKPKQPINYIIELPKGTIKKTRTGLGNKIVF